MPRISFVPLQLRCCFAAILWVLFSHQGTLRPTLAADINDARALFFVGDYEACQKTCRTEVDRGVWNDVWSRLLIESLLITGDYEDALDVYESVAEKFKSSLPLRALAIQAYRLNGQEEKAIALRLEIPEMVSATPWRFSDRDNLLALGNMELENGADARLILSTYYDRTLRSDSKYVPAYISISKLALEKADFKEAQRNLENAVKLQPNNPEIHFLLSKVWANSDIQIAEQALAKAIEINPRHPASLLLQAESSIDAEDYDTAQEILEKLRQLNPDMQLAWALQAAIEHLRGNYPEEGAARKKALSTWSLNPSVDYTIGKILSKHYRFKEGVLYQQRALKLDPNFQPARFQLAQDLLRTGNEKDGWNLATEIANKDPYSVKAYNLVSLFDRLSKFTTLESPGFIVRMESREAEVYGPLVLELLAEARATLPQKYETELDEPISVEIFPEQADFAIRTFGMPGGEGFLGVCFGKLITANSPAALSDTEINWRSVLWHEYCHVVTLQKTQNRMPRWLSEGISVYEETQQDPRWGEKLNPVYKSMLMGEDFVALSKLSSAFRNPKSSLHLQLAYYQSSLAVEYLISQHGKPSLNRLLVDLGMGVPIESAMRRIFGSPDRLDEDFKKFVTQKLTKYLADVDLSRRPNASQLSDDNLEESLKTKPISIALLREKYRRKMENSTYDEAMAVAQKIAKLMPGDASAQGGWQLLANVAREQGEVPAEIGALERISTLRADAFATLERLANLYTQRTRWSELKVTAQNLLAINPMRRTGHEKLDEAVTQLGHFDMAATARLALLNLSPEDVPLAHFRLAEAYRDAKQLPQAREQVLLALERTPRYREALSLLMELHQNLSEQDTKQPNTEEKSTEEKSATTLDDQSPGETVKPRQESEETEAEKLSR